MSATRILDDGEVFVITIDPTGDWAYSRFPHPLITVDYTAEHEPFQIVALGPKAHELQAALSHSVIAGLADSNEPAITDDIQRALQPA